MLGVQSLASENSSGASKTGTPFAGRIGHFLITLPFSTLTDFDLWHSLLSQKKV